MKQLVRRATDRVMRALLKPLSDRTEFQHQQLISKIERLEKRLEAGLAKGQAEARLMASRIAGQASSARPRRLGARIPRHAHELEAPESRTASQAIPSGIAELTACSICGHGTWTPVCEFNRFFLSETAPDADAMRADYALCHRCGVVCARRRPIGERFRFLLEHFEQTLGRATVDDQRGTKVLGSRRLSEDEAGRLRARAAQPMFVSEFPRIKGGRQHLPQLLRDRLAVAAHVEILGSLLTLKAPRVLEIRPRFGAIGAALRRLYGGETFALPLFEAQQVLVREAYGTCADHLLDYDSFQIPYTGCFDLVVGNHLVTHAVRPGETLATIRQRLAPGGHLYLTRVDEADFLETGKSIFNTLNAFHLQTFDEAALARALQSAGFEPVYIGHHHDNCVALARVAPDGASWDPISKKELARRAAKYAQSRDLGVLSLPERLRGVFASEWDNIVQRAFAAKTIDFDGDGNLRILK